MAWSMGRCNGRAVPCHGAVPGLAQWEREVRGTAAGVTARRQRTGILLVAWSNCRCHEAVPRRARREV